MASFFDELPVELGLKQLNQIVDFVRYVYKRRFIIIISAFRESLDKQRNYESERKCLLQETELFKCEKNLAQEKLEQLKNESQMEVNELEKVHFYFD